MLRVCHSLSLSIGVLFLVTTVTCFSQGQFQPAKKIPAGSGYRITPLPGDYDGDGDMDILGTGDYTLDGKITVLFRNDGGEFVIVDTQLPTFISGGMFQWADVDNDNDLDIVAGGCGSYCYDSKVLSIYRNDGADRFTLITQPTNLIGGMQFSMIDFNNDGFIDIEIATQSDDNGEVLGHTFYKNMGNFVFQETFELPITTGEVTWGDLNNDGWQDFVLYNKTYKNLGNGTFEPFLLSITMQNHQRHFIFDADNDGDQDVITPNSIIMLNDGHGNLTFGPILIPDLSIGEIFLADFDGDGNKDMLINGGSSTGAKTQLFHSNGDGTFTAEDVSEEYNYPFSLAVADMDNDRDLDIIASGLFLFDVVIFPNGLATHLSKPDAPSNLQSSINTGTATFSWDAGTDLEQSSVRSNIYLMYDDNFILAPNTDLTTGSTFIPAVPKAFSEQQFQVSTSSLPSGYFQWGVQSVDNEWNTSKFSAAQEFTFYANNPANAPSGLMQTAVTDQSVALKWIDHSTDETNFTIERSSVNGNSGFVSIGQEPLNTTKYTDNTVSPRTVYYYRIRMDAGAAVAYSNVIRIATKSTIAIAPINATAIALTSASAKIDWEYPGTGITGFVIERSVDDKKNFIAVSTVSAEKRAYIDQQIESGRNYYYRLYAINNENVSDYSNVVNITLPFKEYHKITLSSLNYEYRYLMGSVAWGDFDNDGFDDLFLGYKAQLFRNKTNGEFELITDTGIAGSADATNFVAVWGDYDNDGLLDIFYHNNRDKSWIYRGHGNGTFTKVITAIKGDRSDVTNATWTDYDMDGDLDLSMTGGRYIYRNDGNDFFVRFDLPAGATPNFYESTVASWADFDDDGDPDVFWGSKGKDELFRNNGDGSFTSITDQRVTQDYNYDCCPIPTPTALWADFNNDRKLDLTILHAGGPIYAYRNQSGQFDSVFYSYGNNRQSSENLFLTDHDNDGDLDMFSMGPYALRDGIWENKNANRFSKIRSGLLSNYTPSDATFSWNDFDNNGYSDLFQFDGTRQIYKNLSNGNSWIKVRLRGRISNSTGLGAKIFVKSHAGWQRADVTTHHSYNVQQGFMSVFGLGNATKVDSITIIWPTGNRQYLTQIDVNQVVLIDEQNAQEKVEQGPSNLTAEIQYPSMIMLKWTDRSEAETGFVIEMMPGNGQFVEVGTVEANINSFKISNLSTGIKYKFRVRAVTSTNTRWTNIVEAQIRLFSEVFGEDLTNFQSRSEGLAWGDPDGDGDPDLFVGSQSSEPDAIYYNDEGNFTRKHLRSGYSYSRQAQWVDYNNDGHQDLHVSVGGNIIASSEALNDLLYKNSGAGLLVEQTGNILAQDGHPDVTAAWGDLNNDGYLEMIAARPEGKPRVFLNQGGNMIEQAQSFGLGNLSEGILLLSDFDNDRDLDLIVGGIQYDRVVYENVNGQFIAKTNSGLPYKMYNFVLADFDNDGAQDMLIIGQDQLLELYLFEPISKMFYKADNAFPTLGPISKLSSGDFDNNGFLDVFVTGQINFTTNTNRIFLNRGNLTFVPENDPILNKGLWGTALADVNKDGHLDLVALANDNNFDTKRFLLLGSKNENHWLRVRLKGVTDNKMGIGARIRLFTGNTTQLREIRSGSGGTFSDEQIAHFGLSTWTDNSDSEKLFRIERAIGTEPFHLFRKVAANTTSYTDSSFVDYSGPQFDVRYRVVAVTYVTVESNPSNEALARVIGIEEGQDLVMYPQPASTKLILLNEHPIQNIAIMSGRGEVISSVTVPGSREVEIPIDRLAPGVYFLRLTDDTRTIVRKILVASN
jgi:ASPIC and UnbV/FG-GAP-like repeat/Secretion system C-terminal sorting domain/Fibronectin type III domain